MKTTITIPFKVLKAISLFVSNDETRYAINSILFDKRDNEPLNVVGTDGRVLARWQEPCINCPPFRFSLSSRFLAPLIRLSPKPNTEVQIEIEPVKIDGLSPEKQEPQFFTELSWRHSGYLMRLESEVENLTVFPNWRTPVEVSGTPETAASHLVCDANLFAKFFAAKKLLSKDKAIFVKQYKPTDCAVVTFPDVPEFTGLIMPIRINP